MSFLHFALDFLGCLAIVSVIALGIIALLYGIAKGMSK